MYRNTNHTDGKTALFTYFGHSQQLWPLAASLYTFTFLAHLFFLSLISFLPSHSPSNHTLSFFFFLQALLSFFLLFYHFIPFLFSPPKYYLYYIKSLFLWLYYLISVFSYLVYDNRIWSKAPGLQNGGISRNFVADF